ncbi:uncharacterized protein LOC127811239 [Diospyros lotus]|uniref:uncharacterized protein LOC127811239 n=1 Tax=Diospyros lotus TaxID=55363 RepID=UPI002257035E|nr:uncharacterized protein LOC127811239 [Diospyros lotus]
MFLKVQLPWNVIIPAENLDRKGLMLQRSIITRLLDEFSAKKATKDLGYFLAVTTLDNIGEGKVRQQTGDVLFPVLFSCITFKIYRGEILEGVVHKILKHGVFLRCGPVENLYLSNQKMSDYRYVPGENPVFMNDKLSKIAKDVVVRFLVIGTKYIESEKEFQAVVSLEGDYLGPVSYMILRKSLWPFLVLSEVTELSFVHIFSHSSNMDPNLYNSAVEGKVDAIRRNAHKLGIQVTPANNTAVHIAALFGKHNYIIKALGECAWLLFKKNMNGDTALHIAAREGHLRAVEALIDCAKRAAACPHPEGKPSAVVGLLRLRNEKKDTALHVAARNQNVEVVRMLIEEDPNSSMHLPNSAGETPLYIAAERGYHKVVSELLEAKEPAFNGPDRRTALHAAVISNDKVEGCTKMLLEWNKDLAREADRYGWTPLHYAARFNRKQTVKLLLEYNSSIAYLTSHEDDRKTALHVAASHGNISVIKELILKCPDCWEMVNGKGQNILHLAVQNDQEEATEFILKHPRISGLIKQQDDDGNTPFHLLAVTGSKIKELMFHRSVDEMTFNNENETPFDLMTMHLDPHIVDSAREEAKISLLVDWMKKKLTEEAGLQHGAKADMTEEVAPLGWRNVVRKDNEILASKKKAQARAKVMIDIV